MANALSAGVPVRPGKMTELRMQISRADWILVNAAEGKACCPVFPGALQTSRENIPVHLRVRLKHTKPQISAARGDRANFCFHQGACKIKWAHAKKKAQECLLKQMGFLRLQGETDRLSVPTARCGCTVS